MPFDRCTAVRCLSVHSSLTWRCISVLATELAIQEVGTDKIHPATCVRDLGIYIDSDVSMRTQVTRTVVGCCVLHRGFVPSVAQYQSLVVSLVLDRLDFGNATFAGLPAHQYRRLQSVLNAAARLIYRRRRFDHVTPLLSDLHWLKVPKSRLQAGGDCLSVPTWRGTAVSVRRPATCRRTESAPAAFFNVQRPCRPINQTRYCR